MELLVNLPEFGVSHVSIDLGGRDVGMTEHHLNTADISTVLEQVGGERVADNVWGDFL